MYSNTSIKLIHDFDYLMTGTATDGKRGIGGQQEDGLPYNTT